jgi:hypothetical protein
LSQALKRKDRSADLPVPGASLSCFPIGCCVLIEGEASWMLISMKIGGWGNPHCRGLRGIPTSEDWMDGCGDPLEVSGSVRVVEACWPRRRVDSSSVGTVADPVLSPVEGEISSRLDPEGRGVR